MKRAVVFVLMGPALFLAAFLICSGEPVSSHDFFFFGPLVFTVTFPVTAFTVAIDGCLAMTLPLYLRTPLTAIAGATSTVGLLHLLGGALHLVSMRPSEWMPVAVGSALCMGTCSLLSSRYFR
jgi:hypothetical protein